MVRERSSARWAGIHSWSRDNILGVVAIFIALSGTALATGVAGQKTAGTAGKKIRRGPPGPAGPQGSTGPAGPQGPTGPATGPAGGDLMGNYPTPTLAPNAVAGGPAGEIADGTLSSQDLTLGAAVKTGQLSRDPNPDETVDVGGTYVLNPLGSLQRVIPAFPDGNNLIADDITVVDAVVSLTNTAGSGVALADCRIDEFGDPLMGGFTASVAPGEYVSVPATVRYASGLDGGEGPGAYPQVICFNAGGGTLTFRSGTLTAFTVDG